ncbi:hypothetical protein GTZ89_40440 [Streptomyces sp. SID8382]|uniref:hypothetical protein n=1 Tax=Streptomyces malaysiensis TaxID=92644 RepID=UPI000C2BEB31|nr:MULTISPECIES: hypothetical protein [unclassified Streptomyces]AUA12277.1 hypothetical protein CFP59_04406 [Streptomyces sp. M56]MYX61738.1 hypothetical protein [Streptomyces sp. SID8382]
MEFQQRGLGVRRRVRAAAGLVSGGLLAVSLATVSGCSTETAADERPAGAARESAVAALHRAADVLVKSGSSRVRTTMETATGGTRVSIRGTGAYDFEKRLGRLRLLLPKDAMGTAEHAPITELLAPGALFMRNRGAGIPRDKWVRVDTTDIPDGNLVTGGATDPLIAAELLRGVRKASLVGEEGLGGDLVRHYRGTTDIGRAARVASEGVRGSLMAAARGFGESTVPFDAYLDGLGRLREVRHRFTMAGRADGQEATEGAGAAGRPDALGVASTTQLYDFGASALIELPKPTDIYTGKVGSPQK